MMQIDFEASNCTLGEVCVHDCPMALDPRLIAMDEKDSHSQCILCVDCLTSCNSCAAKVPGEKPLQFRTSIQPTLEINLENVLEEMKHEKKEKRKLKKQASLVIHDENNASVSSRKELVL